MTRDLRIVVRDGKVGVERLPPALDMEMPPVELVRDRLARVANLLVRTGGKIGGDLVLREYRHDGIVELVDERGVAHLVAPEADYDALAREVERSRAREATAIEEAKSVLPELTNRHARRRRAAERRKKR